MPATMTHPTPTLCDQQRQDFARAQAYVGTDYVPGVFDCGHLFLQVQREVFGRVLHVPLSGGHALGRAHQAAQIATARDALAVRLGMPEHGCAVLLTSPTDDGHLLWHLGTVFVRDACPWVLHNSAAMGSAALNRLRDFAWRGYRIEGFYQCTA